MTHHVFLASFSEDNSFSTVISNTKIFEKKTNAINYIFEYFVSRASECSLFRYNDLFDSSINSLSDDDAKYNALSAIKDTDKQIDFIEAYCDFMSDSIGTASYEIKCLPTQSFIEQANSASSIEINDDFIRHFNVNEKGNDENEACIEAGEYTISHLDAQDAKYDPDRSCWEVKVNDSMADIIFSIVQSIG